MAAVPRSAKFLQLEDKDGNQLWRFVVLSNKVDNYLNEARKAGLNIKRFTYNVEKYKQEQEDKTALEGKMALASVSSIFIIISHQFTHHILYFTID